MMIFEFFYKKGYIIVTRNSLSLSLSLTLIHLAHQERKKKELIVWQMNCICVVLIDLLVCQVFQVRITRTYLSQQFHDDLKLLYQAAGIGENKQQVVFLFDDTQVVEETFLEDINNILSTGEVGCFVQLLPLFYYLLTTLLPQSLNTPCVAQMFAGKNKKWSLNLQEIHHWNWCFGGETWK